MKKSSGLTWLRQHTKEYRRYICVLTAIEILISLVGVCYAIVMKRMVDKAVAGDVHGFVMGMLGFAGLIAIQLLFRIISRQLGEFTGSGMENALKLHVFSALFRKKYEPVSKIHSEEWMNRMTSDAAICANGMTDILPGFVGMSIRLVGALVLLFVLQPGLALVLIPGGFLFLILTMFLRKPLKHFHKAVQKQDGRVRMYLQERIAGMLIVRTFGVEDVMVTGAHEVMEDYKHARMKKEAVSNLCNSGFSLVMNGLYLLGMGYCGYGILQGAVSFGTLTAVIQLIGQLQSPLAGLSGYIPRYYAMIASGERLMEVEDYPEVDQKRLLSKEAADKIYREAVQNIVFDRVSFCYDGEPGNPDFGFGTPSVESVNDKSRLPVLHQISFSVAKGDYVAITGASGCGKSTLLKVLMGIYESCEGVAEFVMKDGTTMPLWNVRRLFSYVPQGNFLMSGRIKDVIAFGKPAENERLEQVIHLACADFINQLPKGMDTILGEKGAGLSEGQMQRIAIARALYANCPILILDEATGALDEQTEEQLLHNLQSLTDKTVFIVTHRPGAISICNKRLFFENGNVREQSI